VEFRWNNWNADHIAAHGISVNEAEYVVQNARKGYPRYQGDGKYLVRGRTVEGEYIQVAFLIEENDALYVIHARPLNAKEKHAFRRGLT
jgi:uncharacterized DUF497 family protein